MSKPLDTKHPDKSWEELDAFTGWRKYVYWKRGQIRKIKRRYWKRIRRAFKKEDSNET